MIQCCVKPVKLADVDLVSLASRNSISWFGHEMIFVYEIEISMNQFVDSIWEIAPVDGDVVGFQHP